MTAINRQIITSAIYREVASKLADRSGSTDRAVFTSQNPYGGVGDAGIWVRNPNCWLNGINNISCFSPAQRSGANWWQRGGTLLTRKHVAFASHFVVAILTGGTPLIFVDENNNAIRRNVMSVNTSAGNDIAIALLDSEVPSNIKIAKVLPANYASYISTPLRYVCAVNQNENANVFPGGSSIHTWTNSIGSLNRFSSFFQAIVNGDSGNPAFVILDNDLVFLGTVYTFTGAFTHYGDRISSINSAIEALSPGEGYSLSLVDLATIYSTEIANINTLYYNANQDTNWNNVNNWWSNSDHTMPANRLPTARDVVIISGSCTSNTGSLPMVFAMTVKNNNVNFGIHIDTINGAIFENNSINTGIIYGNATFTHNSTNSGTVSHLARFLDASTCSVNARLETFSTSNLDVNNRSQIYGINRSDILGIAQ